jgi:hypothetical protein
VRKFAKESGIEETPDELWRLFIENVRGNLHIVLAMSPVGAGLRNRCRMYPGLVNCTTIDWFHKWPVDALQVRPLSGRGEGTGKDCRAYKASLSVRTYSNRML